MKRLAVRRNAENDISARRRTKATLYKEKIKNDEYENGGLDMPRVEKLRIIKPMGNSKLMQQWRQMTQIDLDTAVSQDKVRMVIIISKPNFTRKLHYLFFNILKNL